jgi:hypothetical protein
LADLDKLELEFVQELRDPYREAKTKCQCNSLCAMLARHDRVETARRLLGSGLKAQTGLTTLSQSQRTELSVEAKVPITKYQPLFSETLRKTAQKRGDELKWRVLPRP